MSQCEPPRFAAWLLNRCTLGQRNDALTGDLLEEFRSGRPVRWYWRQVLAAIVVAFSREFASRAGMLFFATVWSMMAPAWLVFIFRVETQHNLVGPIWRIPWPWSTLSIFALSITENLSFVWAGTLVYFISKWALTGAFSIRQFRHGWLLSLPGFLAGSAAMLVFSMLRPSLGHSFNPATITALGQIIDFRLWAVLVRVPFLIALIGALWSGASPPRGDRKPTVA
jgi:hypothetical protein